MHTARARLLLAVAAVASFVLSVSLWFDGHALRLPAATAQRGGEPRLPSPYFRPS